MTMVSDRRFGKCCKSHVSGKGGRVDANDLGYCGDHDEETMAAILAGLAEHVDALAKASDEQRLELTRQVDAVASLRTTIEQTLGDLSGRIAFLEDREVDATRATEERKFIEDKLLDRELRLRQQAFAMQNMPARLADVEECIDGIERKLNLRRKKTKPEIPPPPY